MIREFKELLEYKEFVKQLVIQNLHSRYRGSVLGFLWTLVTPLLFFVTFTFVLSYVNRMDMRTYGFFFFSGYVAWMFFVTTASQATGAIIYNAYLVTRIRTPKATYPLVTVLMNCVELLAGLLILFALMLLLGKPFTPALAILPLSVLFLVVFVTGISYIFATANVFMRDFAFLWNSLNLLWFFLTPILYPLERIPVSVRPFFEMNPIPPFIRMFQQPVTDGVLLSGETVMLAGLYAALSFFIGSAIFFRSQKSFYSYL